MSRLADPFAPREPVKKHIVAISLTREQHEALTAMSDHHGMKPTELVKMLLSEEWRRIHPTPTLPTTESETP